MYMKSLTGEEFAVQATVIESDDLNGDQTLDAEIYYSKANKIFMDKIERLWSFVDNDGTEYKVVFVKRVGRGVQQSVQIKCTTAFSDYMNVNRIYESYNGSLTFQNAANMLFDGTPYNYLVESQFNAISWENFGGGEAKLKTLQRMLDRYGAEFRLLGNTVIFKDLIGEDTNIIYAHKLNASDISSEIDATECYTYAKGFGDYSDEDGFENANLIREYTSPLANILGERHAPPVMDGRIKVESAMDNSLKNLVDNSVKMSIKATMYMIRKKGYTNYIPNKGDRIFILDNRIGLNEEVRVVNMKTKRDWKGNILDFEIILGSQSITQRHQGKLNTTANSVADIFEGKTKLPFNVLDNAVIQATKALQNAQTELIFPETGGILAVDKTNPNLVTLYNSAGLGVSSDGGLTFKNAITGEGIVAERIIAGTVSGLIIKGGRVDGGIVSSSSEYFSVMIQNGAMTGFEIDNQSNTFVRTFDLSGRGLDILNKSSSNVRSLMLIGRTSYSGDDDYLGGNIAMGQVADYFSLSYRKREAPFELVQLLSWHRDDTKGREGLHFSDVTTVDSNDFRVGNALKMRSTSNGFRIGLDVENGGTYIYMNENGQVGFVHNGTVFQSFAP